MIPYIFLSILLIITGSYSYLFKKNTFLVVYFVILILAILRDTSVGTDFITYEEGFRNYGYLGLTNVRLEPAWYFIYRFFYKFANFRIYVFFFYATLYFYLLRFLWRESKYPIFAVLLYVFLGYYFASYNIMRQSFAVLFVFYSVTYIEKRNLLKFTTLILVGSLFHTSVLLFLPMYFISYWIRNHKKLMSIALLISLFMGYYGITNFFRYLPIEESLFTKYEVYFTMFRKNISLMGLIINSVNTVIAIIFLIWVKEKKLKYYVSLYVIGVCLNNLFFEFEWLFRLYNPLFMVFIIIVGPNLINEIKSKHLKLIFITLLLTYGIGMFYSALNNNLNGVVPYKLIL